MFSVLKLLLVIKNYKHCEKTKKHNKHFRMLIVFFHLIWIFGLGKTYHILAKYLIGRLKKSSTLHPKILAR
jgi:hypothetical protein